MNEIDAWNAYYEDFNKRKNEMRTKLLSIQNDSKTSEIYKVWLDQVIDFIDEMKG